MSSRSGSSYDCATSGFGPELTNVLADVRFPAVTTAKLLNYLRRTVNFRNFVGSLGLEWYEVAFHDNGVDATVLPSLTVEDLKELSVSGVGHRRKLLDAIAALCADANTKAATSDASQKFSCRLRKTAERPRSRSCSPISSDPRRSPQQWTLRILREVISAYEKCVSEALRCYSITL
jgi:hypothetical protein